MILMAPFVAHQAAGSRPSYGIICGGHFGYEDAGTLND